MGRKKRVRYIDDLKKLPKSGHFDDEEFGIECFVPEAEVKFIPKAVEPRTKNQQLLLDSINNNLITFVVGPAGTGKGHISVGAAVHHVHNGWVKKIILTRPVVEVGHSLGALPGSYEDKISVYLVPLQDELGYFLPKNHKYDIEIIPLNYMRGRTFKDSFVILDEAQNASMEQLRMLLTRFGEGSKMVINGDLTQSDIPKWKQGGLANCMAKLEGLNLISTMKLGREDIVRHEIVGRILDRLDESV